MNNHQENIQKQSSNKDYFQTPGLLRVRQIIGDKNNPGILPISKSAFWKGVKEGRYPQGFKLSERTTVWRKQDILAICEGLGKEAGR